ncbi:MAG: 3-isopropylmalate dehydratase large subunit [Bauldia litoralis]
MSPAPSRPLTFFDKVWRDHLVRELGDGLALVYVDRVLLHELSGAIALEGLEAAGRTVRNPGLAFATVDHVADTRPGRTEETPVPDGAGFIRRLRAAAARHGVSYFDLGDPRQGIVHVISPEQGIALPGTTLVCGDSHTCTVGGVGAFGWGIGSTDGEQALATQTVVRARPKTMRVAVNGRLAPGVVAKDLALHLIGQLGTAFATGYFVEFAGAAIRALDVEARLTLCNLVQEMSADTGAVAPDDTVFEYLHGRPYAPAGAAWDAAVAYWRTLAGDEGAGFDRDIAFDSAEVAPQITWGTSPEHVLPIDGAVPDPAAAGNWSARAGLDRALAYVGLKPGDRLVGLPVGAAFIGSCTNARLSDLREAAAQLDGRTVAEGVQAICTPGSMAVKAAAEAEGLDRIFRAAGFEWREPGCSFCISGGAGGETMAPGTRLISTTNRNFENRQGPGVISHLASPATVARSAVEGRIADPRDGNR